MELPIIVILAKQSYLKSHSLVFVLQALRAAIKHEVYNTNTQMAS